jgi:hypothetical protein
MPKEATEVLPAVVENKLEPKQAKHSLRAP